MNALLSWLDNRTGIKQITHEALYERIPGGARWRYVWGSTLVFAFVTQVITGIFLWMCYSPSSRSAWESVYYIQNELQFGWLLRGIHHFMAQMMVVLLVIHLLQVVIDGAYRAPREINFWMGLILMNLVLALSLTGYLLPWDQKGFWATAVATNLMGFVPFIGDDLQAVVVGGSAYGHHTLTRFFAMHAGVLPGLLIGFLVLHVALFRKHGITTRKSTQPDQYFWPDQVLKDAVACLAVLAVVLLLCFTGFFRPHEGLVAGEYLGAELAAPADPSEQFAAARPEWYFLFLFEMLKYFTPETMGSDWLGNEFMGAIVVPGLVMMFLFCMPFFGRWKLGHGFNVAMLMALLLGAGLLTIRSLQTDYYAKLHTGPLAESADQEAKDLHDKKTQDSASYLLAVEQAESDAVRIREIIRDRGGIPYGGAIELMRADAKIQGPKLFARNCASCHAHLDPDGHGIAGPPPPEGEQDGEPSADGAANLYGFASREWLTGLLDPERYAGRDYFGATEHREDEMAGFLNGHVAFLDDEGKTQLQQLIVALSAEAQLVSQVELDAQAAADGTIDAGRALFSTELSAPDAEESYSCTDCHRYGEEGDLGAAPDLTGYGSERWLLEIIANPEHERFYEGNNDRMPAFAEDEEDPKRNLLTPDQIRLIARWLRGDYRVLANGK